MRKIRLVPDEPFYNDVDVTVYDVTEGTEKKRAVIKLEYARVDVEPFQKQGLTLDQVMVKYAERLDLLLKVYLAGDYEITEGRDQVMEILRENLSRYFK